VSSAGLTGWSVSGAGDVNVDTFDDFMVSAPMAVQNGKMTGVVYVLYGGSRLGFKNIYLDNLFPMDGFVVSGSSDSEYFGVSVSAAGKFSLVQCYL
jgi:hypothetical protein